MSSNKMSAAIDLNSFKNVAIRYSKAFSSVIGFVGAVVAIGMAAAGLSQWWLAAVAVLLLVLLACTLHLYIEKSAAFRNANDSIRHLFAIFDNTHNTWHVYKALSDALYCGIELDDARRRIHHAFINLITELGSALDN
jgi:hypothetical protein